MSPKTENSNAFLFHFLEQLNSYKSIKNKSIKLLTDICDHFGFRRGFIYQTDGFQYFYLKEAIGNEDHVLKLRFEISETAKQHSDCEEKPDSAFYTCENEDSPLASIAIENFHTLKSLVIRKAEDTQGKTIGFIGIADRNKEKALTEEEQHILHLALGGLSKEITIREYKEREIRASKTLSSIMNNMGVDIYVNSFDNHEMLYANKSMGAPYGGIEHFEGKKCWEVLYKGQTKECEFCPKKHLIDENGLPTKVYSWDYQRPFDKPWFRVFSAAFAWIDGQMAHVITSVDINHQKQTEEELRIAKEKAENLDRLKSAFLANMSHEIRTPLNSIIGFADLIARSDDKEEREQYIPIMEESTKLLLQLISDILDLSKIEAGTLDFNIIHFNLRDFCEDIVRFYAIKESQSVPILLAPGLPDYHIHSDKKRLMQVVTNFINNALKFTNEGQIILEYHLKENGSEIELSVTDTGIGISPEKINQVFDRFVQLNTFAKGTGLGLSICRSIIENLDGNIGVDSELGVGSRFWFTHPYKTE